MCTAPADMHSRKLDGVHPQQFPSPGNVFRFQHFSAQSKLLKQHDCNLTSVLWTLHVKTSSLSGNASASRPVALPKSYTFELV
ncbi:uncharacterized protein BKA78DRAFT_309597 [Phyllosticta capitalensis]|uniref:uncharacterized protein n=1 Tax=Phyllosticta capitalensis TaxID=121624 RepID=UPI00312F1657